jgi:hypothetical protein
MAGFAKQTAKLPGDDSSIDHGATKAPGGFLRNTIIQSGKLKGSKGVGYVTEWTIPPAELKMFYKAYNDMEYKWEAPREDKKNKVLTIKAFTPAIADIMYEEIKKRLPNHSILHRALPDKLKRASDLVIKEEVVWLMCCADLSYKPYDAAEYQTAKAAIVFSGPMYDLKEMLKDHFDNFVFRGIMMMDKPLKAWLLLLDSDGYGGFDMHDMISLVAEAKDKLKSYGITPKVTDVSGMGITEISDDEEDFANDSNNPNNYDDPEAFPSDGEPSNDDDE